MSQKLFKIFKPSNTSYSSFEEKVLEKVSRKKELELQLKADEQVWELCFWFFSSFCCAVWEKNLRGS